MESYMPFIFSTMTCSNTFAVFAPKTDPTTLSTIMKRIHINGGHGLKNPDGMITPKGVVTKVTDEELQLLEGMLGFRQQVAAGFLVVDKKIQTQRKKQRTCLNMIKARLLRLRISKWVRIVQKML